MLYKNTLYLHNSQIYDVLHEYYILLSVINEYIKNII